MVLLRSGSYVSIFAFRQFLLLILDACLFVTLFVLPQVTSAFLKVSVILLLYPFISCGLTIGFSLHQLMQSYKSRCCQLWVTNPRAVACN